MKTLIYFFLTLEVLFLPLVSKAQYKLKPAFPNIGTFSEIVELVNADDGTNRIFVAQQRGIIYVFNASPSVSSRKVFIDLSSIISPTGSESGILGMAFHPLYEINHYFFVHYTFDSAFALWSRISRFTTNSANPDSAEISSELQLLKVYQPYYNHNGGQLAFGPDGYLYISFGDGGSSGDPGNRAQNKAELLGKILRINVDSTTSTTSYAIPTSNPFYGNTQGYKEEIYAYGFRNVWKFSFDNPTNRLYAADVGEALYEEVDLVENGKNYGWNKMEGFHCYLTCDTTGQGFTRPILEIYHNGASSITGGYVYRGNLFPELYEKYIFADFSFGKIWAMTYDGISSATYTLLFDTALFFSTLGVDRGQELYFCSYSTPCNIYKLYDINNITLNLKIIIEGFYDINSNSLNIRDTIDVYLCSNISPYTIVDSVRTVVDSLFFSGSCFFYNAPSGSYYIVVKHRNALETWSGGSGIGLSKGAQSSYDFTTDSSKAYGNNEIKKGNIYAIYSGDAVQDGIVDLSDLSTIDNDASNFISGYINTDLTGDNFVDLADLAIADVNASSFVIKVTP